ncbi:MAG: acetyl-CoA carboxylase biotin carboxyl carrier protein [Coriobacteriia bacterium]|nr:acetyl-CoA carboxylase biotin carboxyl carrier protein [Coriobacteriia bacterium]
MNINDVKALAEVLSLHGLTSIEVGEGESRIRLKKEAAALLVGLHEVAVAQQGTQSQSSANKANMANRASETSMTSEACEEPLDYSHLFEIKSPLVGVYYAAPSPEASPFVSIGSKVNRGDVLCIIETMKVMNEIVAEQDGEVVDICIKNGDIAEFGQTLFKLL